MTGRYNQSEGGEVRAKPLKDFTEDFFFARMRASAEENRAIAVDAEGGQNFKRQIGIQADVRGVVFDAADVVNVIAGYAERDPPFDVLRFLDTDTVETTEGRRDEKKETVKARFGSLRKTGVDERERDAPVAGFRGEIWPDFRFNQNDPNRLDRSEGASHDRPEIQRTVEHFHLLVRFGVRDLESGCGGGREDAKKIWIELAKLCAQLQGHRDFADSIRIFF